MTILTKYRDIPWEEAAKCAAPPDPEGRARWEARRGTPVEIQVPACLGPHAGFACAGPYFMVVGGNVAGPGLREGGYGCVCPHVAEIGD